MTWSVPLLANLKHIFSSSFPLYRSARSALSLVAVVICLICLFHFFVCRESCSLVETNTSEDVRVKSGSGFGVKLQDLNLGSHYTSQKEQCIVRFMRNARIKLDVSECVCENSKHKHNNWIKKNGLWFRDNRFSRQQRFARTTKNCILLPFC